MSTVAVFFSYVATLQSSQLLEMDGADAIGSDRPPPDCTPRLSLTASEYHPPYPASSVCHLPFNPCVSIEATLSALSLSEVPAVMDRVYSPCTACSTLAGTPSGGDTSGSSSTLLVSTSPRNRSSAPLRVSTSESTTVALLPCSITPTWPSGWSSRISVFSIWTSPPSQTQIPRAVCFPPNTPRGRSSTWMTESLTYGPSVPSRKPSMLLLRA